MLRLVKGMVAETNDVWYWNHPNIDYWVSQQSLVYIKHSPVTGWPAGVILIIRRRNMAPALLGTDREGPWNTALKKKKEEEEACCLLHLAPGLHLTCLVLMKVFCNFTRRKKTEIKNEVTELFNILKTSHSGLLTQTISERECRTLTPRSKRINHSTDIAWSGQKVGCSFCWDWTDWLLFPGAD